MGTLVSKEYANELLEELKKAAEINPAMFNKVRSRLNILKKYEEELDNWWKTEQIKQAEAMELRQSLKSVPKGIIKLEGADKTDLLDYFIVIK